MTRVALVGQTKYNLKLIKQQGKGKLTNDSELEFQNYLRDFQFTPANSGYYFDYIFLIQLTNEEYNYFINYCKFIITDMQNNVYLIKGSQLDWLHFIDTYKNYLPAILTPISKEVHGTRRRSTDISKLEG